MLRKALHELWIVACVAVGLGGTIGPVYADDIGGTPQTQTEEARWIIGLRAGVSRQTQDYVSNASTVIGGVGSAQLLYGFNKIFRIGLTVDVEYQQINVKNQSRKFGDLYTVALMPTVEIRPFHGGPSFHTYQQDSA